MDNKFTALTIEDIEELLKLPIDEYPPQAIKYIYYMFGKNGESYETAYLAMAHYIQHTNGITYEDPKYRITPECQEWLNRHVKVKNLGEAYKKFPIAKKVKGGLQLPLFKEE